MLQRNLNINAIILSFTLFCLIFGFLAIGIAVAAPIEQKPGTSEQHAMHVTTLKSDKRIQEAGLAEATDTNDFNSLPNQCEAYSVSQGDANL